MGWLTILKHSNDAGLIEMIHLSHALVLKVMGSIDIYNIGGQWRMVYSCKECENRVSGSRIYLDSKKYEIVLICWAISYDFGERICFIFLELIMY